MLKREVDVLRKLNHINLLHLHDVLEDDLSYYLVTEYCNNGNLEELIDRKRGLGQKESIYYLKQIMNGFRYLHSHNIMHRDFKPENVFMHGDRAIIGDFGLAREARNLAFSLVGTPVTKAPEILESHGDTAYSSKVDIWSIGVTFYWMIFGHIPWKVSSLSDLIYKARN